MKFLILDWDGKKLVSIYTMKKHQQKPTEAKIINDWRENMQALAKELGSANDTNLTKAFNECVEYCQTHSCYGMMIIADRQARLVDLSPLNTKEIYETAIEKAKYAKNDIDWRKFFVARGAMR